MSVRTRLRPAENRLRHCRRAALAFVLTCPASISLAGGPALAEAVETDDVKQPQSGPNIYIDFSATLARAPGNSFVIGRRGFFSITGAASKSFALDAPLTVDLTDDLTLYAGLDFGSSQAGQAPWSQLTVGSFTTGFDYTFLEQTAYAPELSVSGSVSRPLNLPAGTPLTTTWSAGFDADFALNEDRTRGLIGGLALTYVTVNSSAGSVRPLYGGYVGAYYEWESGWKLTGKAGYAVFGGANLGTLIQASAVQQAFATLELEKYDASDNKIVGVGLAGARTLSSSGQKGTTIQLVISVPLYLQRSR